MTPTFPEPYSNSDCWALDPAYQRIFELARPYLQIRNNELHTRISLLFALRLLESGGDATVVVPAILLHDVGWSRVPEDLLLKAIGPDATHPEFVEVHEREGARIAGEILSELGYPEARRAAIVPIIAGHDSKQQCDSPEEAIVKDADKLYRYSAEAVSWFSGYAHFDHATQISRLAGATECWFHTDLGRRLAKAELDARRAELAEARSARP